MAALATILTSRTNSLAAKAAPLGEIAVRDAKLTAFHQAMLASAAIALIGVVASYFIRDSDAANSMKAGAPVGAEAH